MTLRTILVCLTNASSAPAAIRAAAILARRDNAHLVGLHTIEALVVYPSVAMHIPDTTYQLYNESQKAQTKEIKTVFDTETKNESFPVEWRLTRADNSTAADRILESARAADLVVIAQENPDQDWHNVYHLQERLIRESGRPVLVVPPDHDTRTLGDSVVLGWSATREAARAAHDLLAIASDAAKVRVLRIGATIGDELADSATNELASAYARHGLQVDVMHREKDTQKIADILNHEAFEVGADMLVTGAFGHSRSYDFVIGAATRALLHHAKLPVLFSK